MLGGGFNCSLCKDTNDTKDGQMKGNKRRRTSTRFGNNLSTRKSAWDSTERSRSWSPQPSSSCVTEMVRNKIPNLKSGGRGGRRPREGDVSDGGWNVTHLDCC